MQAISHFLKDFEYINFIKETINKVSNDYKEDESVDAILLWDVMKMQIRASSIKYAKQQKAKQKRTEKTLETEIFQCWSANLKVAFLKLRSAKFVRNWRLRNKA